MDDAPPSLTRLPNAGAQQRYGSRQAVAPTPHRPRLHRVPRRPAAGLLAIAFSQLAVIALWWTYGWHVGLPAMLLTHLPVVWATLTPNANLLCPILSRLPTAERRVWLTIDDGPSDDTPDILDLLDRYHARATFFLIAERAAADPDKVRDIVRRGHSIGNHSTTHPAASFWALGPWRIERELADAQTVLASLTGTPPRWFRSVVGMTNPFVALSLKRHSLTRVGWTARGFDSVKGDPERIVARIERGLRPGAIVLLHEGAPHGNSVGVVAAVLARLHELGYQATLPDQENKTDPAPNLPREYASAPPT